MTKKKKAPDPDVFAARDAGEYQRRRRAAPAKDVDPDDVDLEILDGVAAVWVATLRRRLDELADALSVLDGVGHPDRAHEAWALATVINYPRTLRLIALIDDAVKEAAGLLEDGVTGRFPELAGPLDSAARRLLPTPPPNQ